MLDTITHPSRIHDLKFYKSAERDILLVAGEDRFVVAYAIGTEVQTTRVVAKFGGHENRWVSKSHPESYTHSDGST